MGMKLADINQLGPKARRQIALELLEQARETAAREAVSVVQAPAPRKSKYGNVPTQAHGHKFDSKAEAIHYLKLRAAEQRGDISALVVHPSYRLEIKGLLICRYVADFSFVDAAGVEHCQDIKGVETPAFKLKRKLMKGLLGIDVTVIKVGKDAGYD